METARNERGGINWGVSWKLSKKKKRGGGGGRREGKRERARGAYMFHQPLPGRRGTRDPEGATRYHT